MQYVKRYILRNLQRISERKVDFDISTTVLARICSENTDFSVKSITRSSFQEFSNIAFERIIAEKVSASSKSRIYTRSS